MNTNEKVNDVIKKHNLIHLATIDSAGNPAVRGVDYANGETENILYAITRKDSNKINQIKKNNNIGFCIDHDCPSMNDLLTLKYIKGSALAEIVDKPEEVQKAMSLLISKFPFIEKLPGEKSDFSVLRITLKNITLTDNTAGFGHTELIDFN